MYELTQKRKNKKEKAKTKIRKFHKNILKGGANEVYNETLKKYVPILPALKKVLWYAKWRPNYVTKLIDIVQQKADEVGHSEMKNTVQLNLILKPALHDFIEYISSNNYLVQVALRELNITVDTFINKKISISQENKAKLERVKLERGIPDAIIEPHPTKPGTHVTERKNILLIIPDENKLIPEFIKDLKVLQKGEYYSGAAIPEYKFPETNLPPPQETNLPPPTTHYDATNQELLISARTVSEPNPKAIKLLPRAVEVIGGKKKYKTRNKLSKSRGKMYSRRRRKNNRRH